MKEIPLSELHEFHNHPFQVRSDEELEEMIESVREHGVLVPGIVRKREQGGYEIIAGHTRKHVCEMLGLETMPVFVKELNDDEASIVMVDSNIQRENIRPSEKAKAYKIKYDAMKNQGKAGNSLQMMSEESGENYKSIQRYIWLARLNDDLLALVDHKRLGLGQGVSLSVLTAEEQRMVYEALCRYPKFDLAVNRRSKRDGESDADFFHCTSFGKQAEFVERYFHSGSRVLVIGRVQNNNYTTRDILEEKRLTPNTTPYIL